MNDTFVEIFIDNDILRNFVDQTIYHEYLSSGQGNRDRMLEDFFENYGLVLWEYDLPYSSKLIIPKFLYGFFSNFIKWE